MYLHTVGLSSMWAPAKSILWQKKSLCAKPENRKYLNGFFSTDFEERNNSKNLCFSCPVRKECLQWALESRQVWGVWGGKDEIEIRRALSVTYQGEETRRRRFPNCPFCSARPSKLSVSSINMGGSGRWNIAKIVSCSECGFAWKSRTSANAVEAYQAQRESRLEKDRLRRETIKRKRDKKKIKPSQNGYEKTPLLGVIMPSTEETSTYPYMKES